MQRLLGLLQRKSGGLGSRGTNRLSRCRPAVTRMRSTTGCCLCSAILRRLKRLRVLPSNLPSRLIGLDGTARIHIDSRALPHGQTWFRSIGHLPRTPGGRATTETGDSRRHTRPLNNTSVILHRIVPSDTSTGFTTTLGDLPNAGLFSNSCEAFKRRSQARIFRMSTMSPG